MLMSAEKRRYVSIVISGVRSIHFPGRTQIRSLTKKIEDRERAAAKVDKSMKVARVGSIEYAETAP